MKTSKQVCENTKYKRVSGMRASEWMRVSESEREGRVVEREQVNGMRTSELVKSSDWEYEEVSE